MRKLVLILPISILSASVVLMSACSGTINGSVSCPTNGGACTITAGGTINIGKRSTQYVSYDQFQQAISGNSSLVLSVPAQELSFNTNGSNQLSLSATTDTGYQSSIVLNTKLFSTSPSTVASGYDDYTFSSSSNTAFAQWIAQIQNNSNSYTVISATANTSFQRAGISGSYPIYISLNDSQLGFVTVASTTLYDGGVKNIGGCKPGIACPE